MGFPPAQPSQDPRFKRAALQAANDAYATAMPVASGGGSLAGTMGEEGGAGLIERPQMA